MYRDQRNNVDVANLIALYTVIILLFLLFSGPG